jgi:hypothetical protein
MTAFLLFFDTRLANPPPSSARSLFQPETRRSVI